jgi:hypothetical protein
MSILISEKRGTIVQYYPVYIKSNGQNDYKSQANQIFDLLIGLKFLTYMYDQKFFSVSENNLTKLLMILDHQEIRYKIEDDVDDKIANLKIDDLEFQEPANYSTSHSSYKPPLPQHEQHVDYKHKDFNKGKWESKAKEPTVVKLQQIDQMTYSVKFPYNHLVLTFVKSIEGRYWVNEQKAWHIPHESIDELLYKLKKYNIAFEIQQL